MKIYLASPFFTEQEIKEKAKIKNRLIQLGYEVIDPQEKSTGSGWEINNYDWAKKTYNKDIKKIAEADAILAIDWGLYSDTGTAYEVGIGTMLKKPVVIIAPNETLAQPHSLMMVQSCFNFVSSSRFLTVADLDWFTNSNKPFFLYGVTQK